MRWLYSLLWYLAAPFIALWLLKLAVRDPHWRSGLRDRLGVPAKPRPGGIWVHTASVGEVQAAVQLIYALRMRYPDLSLTLTSFTPTGRDHAEKLVPEGVDCLLLPFDYPGAARRFIGRLRPRVAIVVETELWPNLFAACRRADLPLMMVSARLTESGATAWRHWPRLARSTLQVPEVISAQTALDAGRIQALGADPTRVTIGGNLKFDFQLPGDIEARIETLAAETGLSGRTVWIAASTHEGEELEVMRAHRAVLERHPGTVLVLAPRHPGRAAAVERIIAVQGLRYERRGTGRVCGPATEVFLVDTLGELAAFYGLSRVAFVGGTLVSVGGHNLLEPAAFGIPVLCGPHSDAVTEMVVLLRAADALGEVGGAAELADAVSGLLADETLHHRRGEAARRVLEDNRGAVERVMRLVEGFLDR